MYSQTRPTDREPVAAGRFYTADKETLARDITKMFADCKKPKETRAVRAVIVPHAGYVFSGKTAAAAFSATPKNAEYKNIFIIGSSHIMAFEGASVYNIGDFITPLGKATVNLEIGDKLKINRVFNYPVDAHRQEHSIEVQVPLIQYYYSHPQKIVPIIIGSTSTSTIKSIAEALKPWFTPDNLFVISSDFSHYPSYEDAVKYDNLTAAALMSGDPATFLAAVSKETDAIPGLATRMCGWTSGLLLLDLIQGNKNLEFKKLDYCNSGDSPYGGKAEVVGYNAIALFEKQESSAASQDQESVQDLKFTPSEKKELFTIARNAIRTKLYENQITTINEKKMPEVLKRQYGAFVTLKINGELRGCIGRFISSDPLYEAVRASAVSSAFDDTRFSPLTKQEYEKVEIEITVLGPMKKINNINEIVLGKHGIYIRKGDFGGTMLPQVATEYGWTVEEFLGYTARNKAGIGWDGWKTADIYIYEGLVLEENK